VKRRQFLRVAASVGAGAAVGGASWGVHERNTLGVTTAVLPVDGLPESFRNFRIALLTDLHLSAIVTAELIDHAVTAVMAERPDLVVLGGDFVTSFDTRFAGPVADLLSRLAAPAGVIAVLGNHDDEKAVPSALTSAGIRVLRDQRMRLDVGGQSVDFVGVGFWTRSAARIGALIDHEAMPILVAHDPRRLAEAQELNIPLVLSGHTHGGQVVLPLIGPLNQFRFPITQGTLREKGTTLFVSRGVGTIYLPVRLNCPPEVAMLTLVPGSAAR
jgi:predicted MPP superfamily phosphohydrolase